MFEVDHYAISVGNIEKSVAFYEKLEFQVIRDYQAEDGSVRIVHMQNGGFILELFCYPDSAKLPAFVKTVNADVAGLPPLPPQNDCSTPCHHLTNRNLDN